MCVIINIEDGKFPSFDTLKSAESLNSHGGSIAWLENGSLNYHKGITARKIHKIINRRLKKNHVNTAIIHFRIASVGAVNEKLCHPFQISNNSELELKVLNSKYDLLFHNGTVSNWQEILIKAIQGKNVTIPKGELSDSRIIAFLISHFGHKWLSQISEFNKFSILTKEGIIKYGKWVKVDENECSNDYFIKTNTFDYSGNWWEKYNEKKKSLQKQIEDKETEYDKIANKVNQSKSREFKSKNYIVVKKPKYRYPVNNDDRYFDDFGVLVGRQHGDKYADYC